METDRELVRRFIRYLELEKNASPHTIMNYQADIRDFLEFMHVQAVVGEVLFHIVTALTVRAYHAELQRRGYAVQTIARKIASLRSLYRFICREGSLDTNPFLTLKLPRVLPRAPVFLKNNEIEALLSMPAEDVLGMRNRAILELLYASGLRVSELTGLGVRDVDARSGYVLVYGKGATERLVPVGRAALAALAAYLEKARPLLCGADETQDRLFLNRRGGSLSARSVRRIIDGYVLELAWQQKVSPQTLRHTFAAHLLKNGAAASAVQEMLGHATQAEIERYVQPDSGLSKLKQMHQRMHPRG